MKRLIIFLSVMGTMVTSMAQIPSLSLTTDKTTSLIFPFPIIHVDRGTKDVLAEQVKEAANILLVKAGTENFPGTNLSVITKDGSVYAFPVNYERNPSVWVYTLPPQNSFSPERYAWSIVDNPPVMRRPRDQKWDMLAKVSGIYIHGNTMYYQLQLDNQSPIDYSIDLWRFYIHDKKKSRRTALQEIEMKPFCLYGNTKLVKAHSVSTVVAALEKFTIPDAKVFIIQIIEKNGGRHLFLKVTNNKIIKARPLPDMK